jgi:hypothetical protein
VNAYHSIFLKIAVGYELCPHLALALLHASRFALRLWLSSMAHSCSLCFGGLIVRYSPLCPRIIVHTPSDLSSGFLERVTAFHGRVFLEQFTLGTPQIWATAFEIVTGLVIKGVFIAMLVQRLFRK